MPLFTQTCSNRFTRGIPKKSWLLYQNMTSLRTLKWEFFVRCVEFVPCPCCGEHLSVIGSRKRKYKNSAGQTKVLIIRRLRCDNCKRIHHELPDCLVPYKRYESASIERVVESSESDDVAADDATMYRLRKWFHNQLPYLLGCLRSIAIRLSQNIADEPSVISLSAHQRIGHYVGNEPGWLARIVRPIANSNLWVHTRFTFMSENT